MCETKESNANTTMSHDELQPRDCFTYLAIYNIYMFAYSFVHAHTSTLEPISYVRMPAYGCIVFICCFFPCCMLCFQLVNLCARDVSRSIDIINGQTKKTLNKWFPKQIIFVMLVC